MVDSKVLRLRLLPSHQQPGAVACVVVGWRGGGLLHYCSSRFLRGLLPPAAAAAGFGAISRQLLMCICPIARFRHFKRSTVLGPTLARTPLSPYPRPLRFLTTMWSGGSAVHQQWARCHRPHRQAGPHWAGCYRLVGL
jgi:hypothetical protein